MIAAETTRRTFIGGAMIGLLSACGGSKGTASANTLFAGDQRGGSQVVLEASKNLDDLPYRIEWSAFPNAAPLLEALNAGAIDTGIGGDAAFIFAIGSGASIKAIGAQKSDGRGPVIVVRDNSPIRTLKDIAGRRIATPRGSISHNYVLAALEANGQPYDAVHFAFLSPSDGRAALQSGSVDGWAIWDPNAALAEREGARVLTGGEGLAPGYSFMFGRDGAIREKRAILSDYHRRLYAGWQWQADNRDAYAELMHRETGIDLAIWQKVARSSRRHPVPITADVIAEEQKTADRYFHAKLLARQIDVSKSFDMSFSA
ncbi:MAG TPA: ABC transporter substrate-binding protein [Sphingobium sp.]